MRSSAHFFLASLATIGRTSISEGNLECRAAVLKHFGSIGRDLIFRAIVMLTLAVVVVGFGWTPLDRKQNHDGIENTQAGGETPPSRVLPPPKVTDPNERIADYTFWLMIFTAVLSGVSAIQIYFLNRSDKATGKLADAAAMQARAAVGIELPIIFTSDFVISPVANTPKGRGDLPKNPIISINFHNAGRSPAEIIEYSIAPRITKRLPNVPESVKAWLVAPGTLIQPSKFLRFQCIFDWTDEEVLKLWNGNLNLWVFGHVAFKDFLGRRHDVGYCAMAVFTPEQNVRFVYSSETPVAYIYRKSES
jgi:hypothetical protein